MWHIYQVVRAMEWMGAVVIMRSPGSVDLRIMTLLIYNNVSVIFMGDVLHVFSGNSV